MSTSYVQTATSVATSVVGCSGRVNGTTVGRRQISVGGTPAGSATTLTSSGGKGTFRNIIAALFTAASDPGLTSWAAGTATVPWNLTTGAGGTAVTFDEVYLCQVNSTLTNVATYGSLTAQNLSLASTGVKTFSVTCSALSPSSTDRLAIFLVARNDSGGNASVGVTFDQTVVVPFGGTAGGPSPFYLDEMHGGGTWGGSWLTRVDEFLRRLDRRLGRLRAEGAVDLAY